MSCTCGGTAPGYPQHEDGCGKLEDVCEPGCLLGDGHDEDACVTAEDLDELRLQARDYDAWAAL